MCDNLGAVHGSNVDDKQLYVNILLQIAKCYFQVV